MEVFEANLKYQGYSKYFRGRTEKAFVLSDVKIQYCDVLPSNTTVISGLRI
jgi:hypothetical protein